MLEKKCNDVQQCILSIVKYLDTFCRAHGIEYYLMGGSALGAMRHGGFIPWDDDLDVFMTVDNYDKFLVYFEKNGDKRFFLQKENTKEWPLFLSQICLSGTTMINKVWQQNHLQHHNVFVDIMCLYSTPKNIFKRSCHFYMAQLLRINALEQIGYPQRSLVKKIIMLLSNILVNRFTRPMIIKYVRSYEGKETEYVGHFFGRARFRNATFSRSYIGNTRYVPFEDTMLPVFEHVEDYLVARYGSKWMDMPDKKTMDMYSQHGDFVDLHRDYTEYLTPDKKKWKDNIKYNWE